MDELYRAFLTAAGQQGGDIGDVRFTLEQVLAELNAVRQVSADAQAAVAAAKSARSSQSGSGGTSSSSGSSGSSGSGFGDSVLGKVLKNAFGIGSLVGGLIGLFTGGSSEEPTPVVKYSLPRAAHFEAALSQGEFLQASYDQAGVIRAYEPGTSGAVRTSPASTEQIVGSMDSWGSRSESPASSNTVWRGGSNGGGATGGAAQPQVTVNVQAMDDRFWTAAGTLRRRCGTRC
jgi:hypothetical protein